MYGHVDKKEYLFSKNFQEIRSLIGTVTCVSRIAPKKAGQFVCQRLYTQQQTDLITTDYGRVPIFTARTENLQYTWHKLLIFSTGSEYRSLCRITRERGGTAFPLSRNDSLPVCVQQQRHHQQPFSLEGMTVATVQTAAKESANL